MNFELTRVEAPTMREALHKIRATLGSDALIVRTRKFRRGGVLGVGGQEVVEVYAADTRSRIQNIQRERSNRSRGTEQNVPPLPDAVAEPVGAVRTESPVPPPSPPESAPPAAEILGQSRGQPREQRPAERARYDHPFLRECYETLTSHEVDPRVTDHILDQISRLRLPGGYPDPTRVRAILRAQLAKLFVPNPPHEERVRPRTVVLVGPTGVGKTTTIAKLAARAKINDRRKVGLITIDTYRIAGVDQLEKYAQIIGLPLIVATTPAELAMALGEFRVRNMDAVFIDSAGRSQRDELKMAELRDFLAIIPDTEINLVVSATTHGRTLQSVASRFAGVGFHKLIMTKTDETISFGSLVGALVAIGRPVSYVTDGQSVPDDITPGDPERLADLVLKTSAL